MRMYNFSIVLRFLQYKFHKYRYSGFYRIMYCTCQLAFRDVVYVGVIRLFHPLTLFVAEGESSGSGGIMIIIIVIILLVVSATVLYLVYR